MALTEEQAAYVLANYKGVGPKEMAERIGATRMEVKAFYHNRHLNSGVTGYFPKGHVPWTKGKKPEEVCRTPEALARCVATRFKAGHSPFNHMPVGTETIKDDGYWWRKVAEPNKWKQLHRLKYEEFHGVRLKEDEMVMFLDGDHNNMDPENLVKITKRENQILNQKKLRSQDPEISYTGLAVARLEIAIKDRRKKKNESKSGRSK